ncbi:hypothetical protein CYMTET_40814 [Cymbomonas tetramitiformis]|uniref:Uncharacterized protein n=1 Tax=Cymbomonas tetramitiformis TaxID=36881 RepID=A0AAE0F2W7_9CHLO|nr:hypothetical protein CYMTET_40814 [Cymbomonas tetramitiformis]
MPAERPKKRRAASGVTLVAQGQGSVKRTQLHPYDCHGSDARERDSDEEDDPVVPLATDTTTSSDATVPEEDELTKYLRLPVEGADCDVLNVEGQS